ncbi:Gfo/Idh/MocA family oxidoreductase [Cytophagaceae bacterium ABcell3]|nr:Gfo/Idh/MocA family oxidoreductase [Cytophagaceae bacterium ABcell3]
MIVYNVGLVGFGKGGEIYHAPFISSVPRFNLYKILERTKNRSKELYPCAEIVRAYDDLINDEKVDVIVITVPNEHHFEMAEKALRAGKHVVVDKPFTLTSQEADTLIKLSEQTGKVLTVYHNRRLDSGIRTIKKMVLQNMLGTPERFICRFDRYRPEPGNTWRDSGNPGSGLLYDLGSHLVDHVLYIFGEPESIASDIQVQRDGGLADDYFNIKFTYSSGLVAEVSAGMLVGNKTSHLYYEGSKGSFLVKDLDNQEAALKKGLRPTDNEWEEETPYQNGIFENRVTGQISHIELDKGDYRLFWENLASAIATKSELLVKPQEAALVIKYLEKARQN